MQTQRIPQLDGLRGLAISMVILWHYVILPLRDQGSTSLHYLIVLGRLTWSGVDLFFVLSGFLIGGILLDQSASPDRFRTFYVRRAYRILPIYLVVCIAVELSLFASQSSGRSMPWYSYLTFTQNLWMATHNTFVPLLSYTWSLAVEEQFYLTLPWMIFYLSRKALINALLFTVLTLPVLRFLLFIVGFGDVAMHVLSPARADTLALGVLAAMIVRYQPALELVVRAKNYFRSAALIPFIVLAIATLRDWRMGTPYMGLYGYSAVALCYFCLLLELVIFPNTKLAAGFRIGTLRWLGTIS
jgi:peptidoglycan/LPS O-acetylase OafA/YrhL